MDFQDLTPSERVRRWGQVHYHEGAHGHIVWRTGTGGNTELLDIQVDEARRRTGQGTLLLLAMLTALKDDPPYHAVFGFTRTTNVIARRFYNRVGFTLTTCVGVYADGNAVLFSAPYQHLLQLHRLT